VTGIGRVDQAVLQLRAQLQRLARERAGRRAGAERPGPGALERLRRSRGQSNADEREFRRKFVRALLTEELGEELGNHPEFERISNEVWELLDEDPETRSMMDEAVRAVSAPER
jgi:hypothetical protein